MHEIKDIGNRKLRKPIAVGIVGSGPISTERHIPGFQKLRRETRIEAVCDMNETLAKKTADHFGIPRSFGTLSEMLKSCDLDIVDVCVPPRAHKAVANQAMESGCHVLVEKPIAISEAECDEMIRASERYGVKLSVVHNQIFYPPYVKAQELVNSGKVGKFAGMRVINFTHQEGYLKKMNHWIHKLPGGVVEESGPHAIYMSLPFIGRVHDISATPTKILSYPWVSFDTCSIDLKGANGSSSIIISHAGDYFATEVDLFGTKGMIRLDLQSMLLDVQQRRSLEYTTLATTSIKTSVRMGTGVLSNAVSSMLWKSFLGHDVIIQRFVDCVRDDSPPPVSLEEAKETTRVMEKISSLCAQFSLEASRPRASLSHNSSLPLVQNGMSPHEPPIDSKHGE